VSLLLVLVLLVLGLQPIKDILID